MKKKEKLTTTAKKKVPEKKKEKRSIFFFLSFLKSFFVSIFARVTKIVTSAKETIVGKFQLHQKKILIGTSLASMVLAIVAIAMVATFKPMNSTTIVVEDRVITKVLGEIPEVKNDNFNPAQKKAYETLEETLKGRPERDQKMLKYLLTQTDAFKKIGTEEKKDNIN